MFEGLLKGLSSAFGIYLFFPVEKFYVNGMQEVFGIEVTIASFFVIFGIAGALSEVFSHIKELIMIAKSKKIKAKAKVGVKKSEEKEYCSNQFYFEETTTTGTNEAGPSTPSTPSTASKPSMSK